MSMAMFAIMRAIATRWTPVQQRGCFAPRVVGLRQCAKNEQHHLLPVRVPSSLVDKPPALFFGLQLLGEARQRSKEKRKQSQQK